MTSAYQPLILAVDSDPGVAVLFAETLTTAGFRVLTATDAPAALDAYRQYSPDAVLLGEHVQGLDSFAVCRDIRASRRPDVPVLIAISQNDIAAIGQAYDCGATGFIDTPVVWAALPHRLRYALRTHGVVQQLITRERRNRALLETLPDQIFILNHKGVVVEQITGGKQSAAAGEGLGARTLEDLLPAEVARSAREHLHVVLTTLEAQSFEYQLEGGRRTFETRLISQPGDFAMAIVRDVTARRNSDERIRRLAYFDSVTGLPNRQLFVRELRRTLRQAKRMNKLAAVLYVDLDRFKRINDTFGHSVGDALLKSVAMRLTESVGPGEVIPGAAGKDRSLQLARFGGDEFVVMLTDLEVREQAGLIAARIRQSLSSAFSYEGRQFVVTPSIGIAMYPQDGTDVETLLMHADAAMYQAKSIGRNAFCYYKPSMSARSLERLELEDDLRRAVELRQFELHYQPKFALATGELTGAEALLRWQHPKHGWVPPGVFIPLAEESGLIVALGAWVLDEACRQLRIWHNLGWPEMCVALNISAEQVAHADFAKAVLTAIWTHGIRPQCLELELTESLLMRDVDDAKEMLGALRDAGVQLSIDDFGTGYSSLNYLRQFQLDALKIDRSFVQNLHKNADDAAICAAIIAMGKKLGLKTIAEGIELEEQMSFLREAGCDEGQGFLLGKPVPATQFVRANAFATRDRDAYGHGQA